MGECMYYLKARFPKGTLTKKKSKEIFNYFEKNQEGDDGWAYDCNGEELSDRLHINILSPDEYPDELAYSSCVSHMSDWSHIADSLKGFGAAKVIWSTEENGCGDLDNLQLEDNEKIVKDILKRRILLPSLLGINDELDALIADKLKE